jgi:hypothetical protein
MSTVTLAQRVALALALVIGSFLAVSVPSDEVAAQACDLAYPDFCIPPVAEVGDLDCPDLSFANFTVLDPDPHGFDTDLDGIGCEAVVPAEASDTAPMAIAAADCDPSYPDLCIPPLEAIGDLDCADVGERLTVIHDLLAGATDPHDLDPDGNGIGCASLAP